MSTHDETAGGKAGPRRKLGKGLGALLGEARREEPIIRLSPYPLREDPVEGESPISAGEGLKNLPVGTIEPHPDQPRRRFDEDALAELAQSIAARGVIQPVIVRPLVGGRYQLVAGERRWRAAQKAQVHEIPAIIRDLDDREVTALALIENLQREDLNPVEEARAFQRLGEQEGMTQAEIAKMVDKSRSHVANMQRLLQLPDQVLDHLEAGRLGMGHARALIGAETAVELAERAVAEGLSVREVEKLVRGTRNGGVKRQLRQARDSAGEADIAAVQNHLEEFLGMNVRISTDADPRSGAVTIRYRTLDQLDLVCQRLTGASI